MAAFLAVGATAARVRVHLADVGFWFGIGVRGASQGDVVDASMVETRLVDSELETNVAAGVPGGLTDEPLL